MRLELLGSTRRSASNPQPATPATVGSPNTGTAPTARVIAWTAKPVPNRRTTCVPADACATGFARASGSPPTAWSNASRSSPADCGRPGPRVRRCAAIPTHTSPTASVENCHQVRAGRRTRKPNRFGPWQSPQVQLTRSLLRQPTSGSRTHAPLTVSWRGLSANDRTLSGRSRGSPLARSASWLRFHETLSAHLGTCPTLPTLRTTTPTARDDRQHRSSPSRSQERWDFRLKDRGPLVDTRGSRLRSHTDSESDGKPGSGSFSG